MRRADYDVVVQGVNAGCVRTSVLARLLVLRIAENGEPPVKSRFALQDLIDSGAAVQWHNNVISAARSRKRETASATPTTSPSGAGILTCVRCTPRSMARESGSASA